jgi:hypothetical protein
MNQKSNSKENKQISNTNQCETVSELQITTDMHSLQSIRNTYLDENKVRSILERAKRRLIGFK